MTVLRSEDKINQVYRLDYLGGAREGALWTIKISPSSNQSINPERESSQGRSVLPVARKNQVSNVPTSVSRCSPCFIPAHLCCNFFLRATVYPPHHQSSTVLSPSRTHGRLKAEMSSQQCGLTLIRETLTFLTAAFLPSRQNLEFVSVY